MILFLKGLEVTKDITEKHLGMVNINIIMLLLLCNYYYYYYYCCCCFCYVDIFNEIHVNFKVRDKNENEDVGLNSIQVIPTTSSFKRIQEQTTAFINERREDDEDENELSILPQARVNSIVFEGERPLAVEDPTYDRLAGTSNSSNTNTVTTNKRQSENEPKIKEDINR